MSQENQTPSFILIGYWLVHAEPHINRHIIIYTYDQMYQNRAQEKVWMEGQMEMSLSAAQ